MTPRHRLTHPRSYIKAILATAAVTVAAALGNAMADGNITGPEVIASVGLGLGAGAVVYLGPKNRPPAEGTADHPVDWS